jgi:hypothetical protein
MVIVPAPSVPSNHDVVLPVAPHPGLRTVSTAGEHIEVAFHVASGIVPPQAVKPEIDALQAALGPTDELAASLAKAPPSTTTTAVPVAASVPASLEGPRPPSSASVATTGSELVQATKATKGRNARAEARSDAKVKECILQPSQRRSAASTGAAGEIGGVATARQRGTWGGMPLAPAAIVEEPRRRRLTQGGGAAPSSRGEGRVPSRVHRSMRLLPSLVLVSLTLLPGCKRRAPPPPPEATSYGAPKGPAAPSTAPSASFDAKRKLTTAGYPDFRLELSYSVKGGVFVTTNAGAAWPERTKIRLAGKEGWLTSGVSTALDDVWSIYGGVAFAEVPDGGTFPGEVPFSPSASLTIAFDNGVTMAVPLPPGSVSSTLADRVMRHAAEHGLVFDGEKPSSGPRTTYYLPREGVTSAVIGPGTTLADVAWLAIPTSTVAAVPGKTCAFLSGKALPLEAATMSVKIVDRRTKERIDEKAFEPKPGACPLVAWNNRAIAEPDRSVIFAWIKSVAATKR